MSVGGISFYLYLTPKAHFPVLTVLEVLSEKNTGRNLADSDRHCYELGTYAAPTYRMNGVLKFPVLTLRPAFSRRGSPYLKRTNKARLITLKEHSKGGGWEVGHRVTPSSGVYCCDWMHYHYLYQILTRMSWLSVQWWPGGQAWTARTKPQTCYTTRQSYMHQGFGMFAFVNGLYYLLFS